MTVRLDENESKSMATHHYLSQAIDIWIPEKPWQEKTDLMNFLVRQMNVYLEWRYEPKTAPQYDTREYPDHRPECLKKGNLDTRIWTAMVNDGHMTVEDLARLSDRELLMLPNVGRKTIKRLRELELELGLAGRKPNRRDDDDERVDPERPEPPRIGRLDRDEREDDRADDRDEERESDRQDQR